MRVIAITLLLTSTLFASDLKIAVVNMQRVLIETKMGKDAAADLEIAKLKIQKDKNARDAELQILRDALKSDESKLSDAEKTKRQNEIDKKERDAARQNNQDTTVQDLQKKELGAIKEAVGRAIRKVVNKQGIDAVFEAGQLFDFQRRIDITDAVIEEMDR